MQGGKSRSKDGGTNRGSEAREVGGKQERMLQERMLPADAAQEEQRARNDATGKALDGSTP
jgi:hypothetical protein